MANNIPFLPARGKEADILARNPSDGMVWFATDTRKIYYSNGTDFISMGGNSGIYYGQMRTAETPEEGQKDFDFLPEDIEGNENDDNQIIPNPNDLIFNSPDNSFYRVIEVEKDGVGSTIIHTRLLTVAGGGGGGSGGGGGGESTTGKMTLSRLGNSEITVLEGASCLVGLHFIAVDASGEQTGNGTATIWVGGTRRATQTIVQGDNWIDVGKYLDADTQIVQIYVEASIGGVSSVTQNKRWTVNKVRLNVNWDYNDTIIQSGDNVLLTYSVSTNIPHQVHIIIDDMYEALPPQGSSTSTQTYRLSKNYGLTHGSHKVSMYVTADINGTEIISDSINHTILYAEDGNTAPIIAFANYIKNMTQYDTLLIPIIVYDPTNTSGEVTIILREDGIDKDQWTIVNGSTNTWSYTPTTAGIHRLLVVCGNTEIYQDIDVIELVLNNEEVPEYEFKFKASDFISNNTVQNWNSNGITATFSSNFDWNNGGLHLEETENGSRQYFCVRAGTTMTINAQPFSNLRADQGKTIKVIYKATNCRNYDAQVLSCIDGSSGTDRGILINAQNALISCSSTYLNVPTCEDTYIELEMDVWNGQRTLSGIKQNYLMSWLDGVPAGCDRYTDGTQFYQDKSIVIGSEDCDVYIYLIKSYNRHLTEDQHLANFIADAYNAQEMIDRYRRNDILGDNGDISYTKLALAAPKVKLHLYEIPRMTQKKKDEVLGCTYQQFYGSTEAEVSAANVSIQGQGTSSSQYGISAFNLDSKFYDGFDYPDGSHTSKYSMTPTSIPVNYFNTKVNVASCEGANNALNQEWYNKWQPFICEYRAKNRDDGKIARDTMEFPYPGIVFVKDLNTEVSKGADEAVLNNCFKEVSGYVNNPYYKMYAIGNMGNSKKNTAVFHDANNPYDCCVENLDNQRPEQLMTDFSALALANNIRDNLEAAVYIDSKGKEQPAYEFRFIADDTKKVELSNSWYDLVSWFMENDPSPFNQDSHPHGYTGELLDPPVTFTPYTFKGYTSDKTGYVPEKQILKGLTINTYAKTYTHDTYEYRIAKLLSECEDHLIMDALVYHYLMIERHCMIDNVAKNTFWNTEDGVHWAPIKDYDNDTADGNDNQGALTLRYGYETLDKVDGKDLNVFNAQDSVWLHFIEGLYLAREKVYQELDKININGESAWDSASYLKMFEDYQNAIPERCWIADYHKKYLRPYEVYGEHGYIFMLEGGKKTHQRRQFEVYQEQYMSSEYFGRNASTSAIEFRANTSSEVDVGEVEIILTMYSDCYINVAFGSGADPNVSIKAKRNVPVVIHPPAAASLGNATTYFFSAGNIVKMDKAYTLLAQIIKMGKAVRLREFALGSDDFVNNNLTSVEFGSNVMLEKLYLQNLGTVHGGLDLSNLKSLRELNTHNSPFSSLIIARNAPVQSLKLNALNQIQLYDLYNLEEFEMDGYNKLSDIFIDNIDNNIINSKNIVMNTLAVENNVFSSYMLKNVKWIINDINELNNNKPQVITILNALLEEGRVPQKIVDGTVIPSTRQEGMTGSLIITNNNYTSQDALDIYNYYASTAIDGEEPKFPALDINFTGNQRLFNVTIFNGQNQPCWTKKLTATTPIDTTFLSSGPNGNFAAIQMANYQDTASVYSFQDAWDIYMGDTLLAHSAGRYPYYSDSPTTPFTDDITIYPVYTSVPRQYTATFIVNGETFNQAADYDTLITDIAAIVFPNGLFKSDVNLPVNFTYKFSGWTLMQDSTNVIVSTAQLKGDTTYYAYFEQVDVHQNVNPNLFRYEINRDGGTPGKETITISPQNPLALQGKVTIPKMIGDHLVTQLADFQGCTNLSHIFFANDSKVRYILAYCFSGLSNLKYFEPVDSLEIIDRDAFKDTSLRIDLTNNDYVVGGNNVIQIVGGAFQNAFVSQARQRKIIIPSSAVVIGSTAFGWEDRMPGCTIEIGSVDNPSLWDAQQNPGNLNNLSANDGYRFPQNSGTNITLNLYSRYYENENDIIPPRSDANDDPEFTLLNAIADIPGNMTINIVHVS